MGTEHFSGTVAGILVPVCSTHGTQAFAVYPAQRFHGKGQQNLLAKNVSDGQLRSGRRTQSVCLPQSARRRLHRSGLHRSREKTDRKSSRYRNFAGSRQREQLNSIATDRLPAILISSPARSAVADQTSGPTWRKFSPPKSIEPGSNEPSNETFWSRSLRSTKY